MHRPLSLVLWHHPRQVGASSAGWLLPRSPISKRPHLVPEEAFLCLGRPPECLQALGRQCPPRPLLVGPRRCPVPDGAPAIAVASSMPLRRTTAWRDATTLAAAVAAASIDEPGRRHDAQARRCCVAGAPGGRIRLGLCRGGRSKKTPSRHPCVAAARLRRQTPAPQSPSSWRQVPPPSLLWTRPCPQTRRIPAADL